MTAPRIKPSAFFRREAKTDLFVEDHRETKLGSFVANLAAIDQLVDSAPLHARSTRHVPTSIAAKAAARHTRPRSWCASCSCKRCAT